MSKSQKGASSPNEREEIESGSKKLLNRKTKRENTISLDGDQINLSDEIRCSICLEYEKVIPKCYKCSRCSSYFHLDCYNFFIYSDNEAGKILNIDQNNFICNKCEEEKKNNSKLICHYCGDNSGIIKKLKENQYYIHHYCYVFFKENLNPKNGKCKNCKVKNIPVLKCETQGCKDKYHIKCAIEKGIIFSLYFMRDEKENRKDSFDSKINFFCDIHNEATIKDYRTYASAMAQSMHDTEIYKKPNKNDNASSNNNSFNNTKNEQKNIENNNEENKENDLDNFNKSLSITSNNGDNLDNGDNYASNNDSRDDSEKTPRNNYPINENNSSISKNDISNDPKISNDTISGSGTKDNKINQENPMNNRINLGKRNNSNFEKEKINNKMEIDEGEENKNDNKDFLNENNAINKEDENDDYEKRKKEYKIPEIKYEKIDLYENFKKMNENYIFPGSFYKFHVM